ncbi:3-isopropylmalate dehydratase small subunit [Picrophilus oshimae]|uniref:3-isopropylmalate dehydratase small subunit n=1 Tax=Picrophilus torridus (strain ATCC 700027 / DSM 9790 / JCM 10055 / NBRC 100828 / KAW 2/3) TaxID=1122961 RepID=Q6L0K6_PICTO|nr:3-isopropylmalate dehydratase small subunit [Picrophilus oshimae]AAT43496.1 3-isopropylmalate dehydratase small subunit [Picrophilus oshimae DSM 9789]SMD30195.1 3-isopropylmalate dehydratase, small subunit [Picrophilus oshimae DSM 9789]
MITGKAWILGDNIDTDQIIPARYLNTSEPEKLAPHFMEYTNPELASMINKGDIIVAGKNFGSGSSREHAVITIKALGVSCVIAESFARIFFRNAINNGLLLIEAKVNAKNGSIISIDMENGIIKTEDSSYRFRSYPDFIMNIVNAGGLINYVRSSKW